MARTKAGRKAKGGVRHDDFNAEAAKVGAETKKRAKNQLKVKGKAKYAAKVAAQHEKKQKQQQLQLQLQEKRLDESERSSSGSNDRQPSGADDGFIQFGAAKDEIRSAGGGGATGNATARDTPQEDTHTALTLETRPWIQENKRYTNSNVYARLHEEIMDFVRFVSPTEEELSSRIELIEEMREIVQTLWPGATVETFGSHYTQMFLPQSDIDMVLFGVPEGTQPLFKLAQCLEEKDLVSYLEVIDKARIPIVKMVHKASDIHVDVSFNVAGGLATGDLVRHFMRVHPSFRPLTLVLKYFMAQRGLNETYSGGVGSFLLQLMVVSFLQHTGRALGAKHDDPRFNNLGQLLVGFFTLYGRDFNYTDLGISVRNGGSYFYKEDRYWCDAGRPFLIAMENPNEPSLDVGKNSYEIRTVQRSFDYARQVLQNEIGRHGRFKSLSGSILGTIIQADSNLMKREPPSSFGFDVLHHDPEKTAEIRKQYEMRRDEEMNKKRAAESATQSRRKGGANEPPYKRWRERSSRAY
ncbi:unnamed protein product [Hyaloperonospora brassicae]|uniref:Polymerase nucleotidyl transferase domain-containing protein n=1 Tax=Hyaloperonospora brassicae TaxID=162125 RepID=A0AAV0UC70_HYABA|nr:unnamed protein product [Hyaloperonospora brassicae]